MFFPRVGNLFSQGWGKYFPKDCWGINFPKAREWETAPKNGGFPRGIVFPRVGKILSQGLLGNLFSQGWGIKFPKAGENLCFVLCASVSSPEAWHEKAANNIENRANTCFYHIKAQTEKMLAPFKSRAGRWDLEGLRLEITTIITKKREEARVAEATEAMNGLFVG